MEALALLLVVGLVFLPWWAFAFWASMRVWPERGSQGIVLVLRIAVMLVLGLFLPGFAGLLLYFWAFLISDTLILAAVAYPLAFVAAYWLTRRLQLPFRGQTLTLARIAVFLELAFWLPVVAVEVPAVIVAIATGG